MSALPLARTGTSVHAVLERLLAIAPGSARIVSCLLKLEPRDKTRGKYLIKMKNRVRETVAELARRPLERAEREAIAGDLERLLQVFDEPGGLPAARGVAVYVCARLGLHEIVPLPQVHRSRLAVDAIPLVRELVALEQEFGTILVAACDRTGARFFAVTAFDVIEMTGLTAPDASRGGKFHGAVGGTGEHGYHNRIREEKQRHYARVADHIFHLHAERPLSGIVVAGVGVDAAGLVPHLHTYLHDLLLGVVRLNPKALEPSQVREAALALREERERAWELAHAAAVKDGVGTGWAVNGIAASLAALNRGQVRTLLADGTADDPRLDEAVEEALRQRAQVDVLYEPRARRVVDGLAALLRFRR